MPRPAALEKWWAENGHKIADVLRRAYPTAGSHRAQLIWYESQFMAMFNQLKRDKPHDVKGQAAMLRSCFAVAAARMRLEDLPPGEKPHDDQYRDFLEHTADQLEERISDGN
jgi:hypothetical protein